MMNSLQPFLPEFCKIVINYWTNDEARNIENHFEEKNQDLSSKMKTRMCRFCFEEEFEDKSDEADEREEDEDDWISPCLCMGTMEWVHRRCFDHWIRSAPVSQRVSCYMCHFTYRTTWTLKSLRDWSLPSPSLTLWDGLEITIDLLSTYRMLKGFVELYRGRHGLLRHFFQLIFWRTMIITDWRLSFYCSLIRSFVQSFAECRFRNCRRSKSIDKSSSDPTALHYL